MTSAAELKEKFKSKEYRDSYAEELLFSAIALQIKALREQRDWTQKELAERAGMRQSRISAIEQADYSSWSIRTLRRLACAFDLPLIVRFESWSKILGILGRTGRSDLERVGFEEEMDSLRTCDKTVDDEPRTVSSEVTMAKSSVRIEDSETTASAFAPPPSLSSSFGGYSAEA